MLALAGGLALAPGVMAQTAESPGPEGETVTVTRLRALDKVTARISEIDLVENEEVRFGSLYITARTCSTRPPEEPPETFAFLEIEEANASGARERLFTGWMVASSPALNALDHPIYDVWVISCTIRPAEASSGSE